MPMSTDVKFFSSTMPNAPQISSTQGSLIAVLDACLVDGWNVNTPQSVTVTAGVVTAIFPSGHPFVKWQVIAVDGATPSALNGEARVTDVTANSVKWEVTGVADGTATGTVTIKTAPLGWLKPFSGANKGAYKINTTKHPDAPGFLVRFDDNYTYTARVAGYESMTSIDVGDNKFPTDGQRPDGLRVAKTESNQGSQIRSWFIIGDGRLFYLGINNFSSEIVYGGPTWSAFGNYDSNSEDAFAFVITGGGSNDTDTIYSSDSSLFFAGSRPYLQYIARSYDSFTFSKVFEIRSWPSVYGLSGGPGAPMAYPNGPNNGLYLCPTDIVENNNNLLHHRGAMPGAYMLPHNLLGRIVPDRRTPVMDNAIAGFEGRVVGFYPVIYTPGTNGWGVVAFDLTGPWEH